MWNNKPFVIFLSVVAASALLFLFFSWRTVTLHKYLLHNGIQVPGKIIEHLNVFWVFPIVDGCFHRNVCDYSIIEVSDHVG